MYIALRKAAEAPRCQILLKDSLKRHVLRRDLKVVNDVEFLIWGGRVPNSRRRMSKNSLCYIAMSGGLLSYKMKCEFEMNCKLPTDHI